MVNLKSAKSRAHTIVKGYVQGIGYRWFVEKTARSLNITGWVKNLPNGNVEVEAEGSKENIEKLLYALKNEHPWARVSQLEVSWIDESTKNYEEFQIKF